MQRGVVMVNTYDYSLNLGQIISSAYLSFYNYCMFYSQKFKQVIEDVLWKYLPKSLQEIMDFHILQLVHMFLYKNCKLSFNIFYKLLQLFWFNFLGCDLSIDVL